ncbi:uncharacterized protein J3R85_005704 [Psidium guajava]|nr:uncharacterized protein J3R85_005704 [Psidium guajava]
MSTSIGVGATRESYPQSALMPPPRHPGRRRSRRRMSFHFLWPTIFSDFSFLHCHYQVEEAGATIRFLDRFPENSGGRCAPNVVAVLEP